VESTEQTRLGDSAELLQLGIDIANPRCVMPKPGQDVRKLRLSIDLTQPPKYSIEEIARNLNQNTDLMRCLQNGNFKVKNYAQSFLQKTGVLMVMMEDIFLNFSRVFNFN